MQCTQHPHFAVCELVGPRAFLGEGHPVGARGVEHEPRGDARDARQRVVGPHEHAVAPPQHCAVGAFDDVALLVDDDGFAGAERLHGGAQRLQRVEVGAFHKGPRAHVARRRGKHHLGARRGSRPQSIPELRVACALAQFDARKVVARSGQAVDDGGDERFGGRQGIRVVLLDAVQKPRQMAIEPAHATVDDAPRVGDEHCAVVGVAPVDELPTVAHPGVEAVLCGVCLALDHKIQRMRPGVLACAIEPPVDPETVVEVLEALHPGADGSVWLDSGVGARTGHSLAAIGERVLLDDAQPVLPQLRGELEALAVEHGDGTLPLGLIGWFGYELRAETMGMPVDEVPSHHRAAWLRVDRGVTVDHESGECRLIALDPSHSGQWSGELDEWRQRMLGAFAGERRASRAESAPLGPVVWRDTDDHYADLVRACQRSIRDGDAYQLCLTTQARVDTADDAPLDAAAIYRRLRRSSPAHHGALVRIGETTLLSASPETFLRVDNGVVQTRPIKGTRPRGSDAQSDAELAAELAASDKEQAENLMIVDLMRNDLSRVCEVGSVTVTGLLEVESYAHVHQLVSTIEGRLRDGLDALDAVAACLPAGSMTGAPKRRAIELLAELEAGPRGVYSGAFGYLGADGNADLAMVIRSIVIEGGTATVGAGGGITALSEPEAEVAEMRLKAEALLRALGADAHEVTR